MGLSWERPLPRLIRRPGAAIMAMEATEALVTEAMAAMATTVERGRLKPLLWLTLSLRLMPMLGDTATAMAMPVPTTVATTALGIMARGLLTMSLKLMLMPAPTTMATSAATGIWARGLLMPRLMPMLGDTATTEATEATAVATTAGVTATTVE